MYKTCGRCGRVHIGACDCQRIKTIKATNEQKLRSTWKWTEKSKEIRDKAHYLCEVCKEQGQITYDNVEVHHITKIKDDRGGLLDNYNLICLCQEHHKKADKNEMDADYLRMLAKKREDA